MSFSIECKKSNEKKGIRANLFPHAIERARMPHIKKASTKRAHELCPPNSCKCNRLNRLTAGDVTGVLAVGVVGLGDEVVDPLEEVSKGEALGESLAGAAGPIYSIIRING